MIDFDAAAILGATPEKIFSADAAIRRQQFNELVKKWHPDHGGSADVMARLVAMRDVMEERSTGRLITDQNTGKSYRFIYRRAQPFELGEILIGVRHILFVIDKVHEDLVLNGIKQIGSVNPSKYKMPHPVDAFFPKIEQVLHTATGYAIMINKPEDVVMLADLLAYLKGSLEPRHAAWIISSLLNLACVLQITKMTHNGLTSETVWISPKGHASYLLGGWWYAAKQNSTLKWLPPAIHALASPMMLAKKQADGQLDLESIRAIGRACFDMATAPLPIKRYLTLPAASSAIQDYEAWSRVLADSFGPRKFVKLSVDAKDIYS